MTEFKTSQKNRFRFANFELDLQQGELKEEGEVVQIRHQTLKLLAYLLQHQDRTVSRQQLARHLWGNEEIDYDQRLNAAVRDLRKSLNDDQRDPPLIKTLPRTGYRINVEQHRMRPRSGSIAALTILITAVVASLYWYQRPNAPVVVTAIEDAAHVRTYIQARALLDSGDPQHLPKTQELLEAALDQSPTYADAWAALSELHLHKTIHPSQMFPEAKKAAAKALEIDGDHLVALRQAATIAISWDRDLTQAQRYLDRAMLLAPGDAMNYHAYAALLYVRGELVEGESTLLKGLAIDPLSIVMNSDLVWYRVASGDYERALDVCDLLAKLDSSSQMAMSCRMQPNLLLGRVGEAASFARQQILSQNPDAEIDDLTDGELLSQFWQAMLTAVTLMAEQRYMDPTSIARLHANLGDPASTLDMLEQAVLDRSAFAPYIHLFPEFRALHAHPRFLKLLSQLGLPREPSEMLAMIGTISTRSTPSQ